MSSWFAVTDNDAARRVGPQGLVIGRAPTCDVVLDAPEVSRRHVLLQLGMRDELDVVPLPNAHTSLNGVVVEGPMRASDGDVLAFPGGATLRLVQEGDASRSRACAWLFEVREMRIGLRREPLEIGGGEDDVMIETWPAAAAQLTWRGDEPWLEARVDGMTRNGVALPRGESVALAAGDRIACGERTITIASESAEPSPTRRPVGEITSITLETLPTGGTLTIHTSHGDYCALLAERRFALVSTLLRPPPPFRPGEYIPDELVFAAVWPRNEAVDRGDLNQLASRLRADLRAAGFTAPQLIERYVKGGATRFIIGPSVPITART